LEQKFTLLSVDLEPSDEQLHEIMRDAIKDVIEEHRISDENFFLKMEQNRKKAFEKFYSERGLKQ
jgi:hypothetical protein